MVILESQTASYRNTVVGIDESGSVTGILFSSPTFPRVAERVLDDSVDISRRYKDRFKQAVLLAVVKSSFDESGKLIGATIKEVVPTVHTAKQFEKLEIAVLSNGDVPAEKAEISMSAGDKFDVQTKLFDLGFSHRKNEIWVVGKSHLGGRTRNTRVKLLKIP